MRASEQFPRLRTSPVELARRARLLSEFDRSGLSAAAFARRHHLTYTTFCGWRKQRARTQPPACAKATAGRSPGFVQVELPTGSTASEVTIELGAQVRLRLTAPGQVELAALLIHKFNASASC